MALNRVSLVDLELVSIADLQDVDTATVPPILGQALTWNGTAWVPGAGGGGGSAGEERRHAWQPPYSYTGRADADTLESEALWAVSRIELFEDGQALRRYAQDIRWEDRSTATYGLAPINNPERRYEQVGTTSYLGLAEVGTPVDALYWQLTRLVMLQDGTTQTLQAVDSWNNRAAAVYS
jgi:hypothetical protein